MLDKKIIASVFGFESEAKFNEGITAPLNEGNGGEDGWGANCNVGLIEGKTYLVILRGAQRLNIEGMTAEEMAGMANNLVVTALPVTVNPKGRLTMTGTAFTAVVGGRALCQAGISDCNSKNTAMQSGTPVLVSFENVVIPEEKRTQRQKDNNITTKKVYSASRLSPTQEKDVQGFLPTPAPTEPAPVKGK